MVKKIEKLPVRDKREGAGDLFLAPPPATKCSHLTGRFEIDKDAGKCTCRDCGGEVSPMFVLEALMHRESRWMRSHEIYHDQMKRLDERSRTKCRHCGEMTRISHR